MYSLRNKFLALAVLFVGASAHAQQSALNDVYLFNPTVVDPTFAGQTQYQFHSAFQQKWVGVEGAPRTLALYGDFNIKTLGVHVGIQSDQAGPVTRTSPASRAPPLRVCKVRMQAALAARSCGWRAQARICACSCG